MTLLLNKTTICRVVMLLILLAGNRASAQQVAQEAVPLDDLPQSPAVKAVLALPRQSPADQLRALLTLLDLGEPLVAASLWEAFSPADLDDEARAALAADLGTARLLRLARQERPVKDTKKSDFRGAREFVASCLEAASKLARDPARLTQLVADLHAESPAKRNAARVDLAATGTAGGVAILEALARAEDDTARANLMLALAGLRPEVDPLLVAVLADGRGQLRRDVAELAGHTRFPDAAPWLAAIAAGADSDPEIASAATAALEKLGLAPPTAEDARAQIRGEIRALQSAATAEPVSDDGHANWWAWRQEPDGNLVSQQYATAKIRQLAIDRLARTLISIGEPAFDDLQTALLYGLETADMTGLATAEELSDFSTEQLSVVLEEAMRQGHLQAALACANQLSELADPESLGSYGGRPAPLVEALRHPHRDLRFTALEAVMRIAPDSTFAGASGVPTALWYFASGAGSPQAIAAASVSQRALEWAAQLRGLGFDATPTGNGREALRAALVSPRLQLILVDSDIEGPTLREVIYQLRSTPQTSQLPIAVLCSLENFDRAQQIATADPWLLATLRPHGEVALAAVVNQLSQMPRGDTSRERRVEQARQALVWIATLLEQGHPYDELLRNADLVDRTLQDAELQENSLRVLAALGTVGSQQVLVDTASNGAMPIEARRAAAKSLAQSIARYGKLLTPSEVARQYDRYNASETADRQTQQVLGQVLDILEEK